MLDTRKTVAAVIFTHSGPQCHRGIRESSKRRELLYWPADDDVEVVGDPIKESLMNSCKESKVGLTSGGQWPPRHLPTWSPRHLPTRQSFYGFSILLTVLEACMVIRSI